MITNIQPRSIKTYILYHGNCADGCGAALASWLRFGEDAEYIPVNYGKPLPEIEPGSDVFILDFSYPRAVLEELNQRTHKLVVLDHHATAQADLAGLDYCTFNMSKSGAVLAWEHFHPGVSVPYFIFYLQDRDLWKFQLPFSRAVSAAIGSYPLDFRLWAKWIKEEDDRLCPRLEKEGIACLRLKNQQVDHMVKHHRWVYLDTQTRQIRFTEKLEPGGNGDPMVPSHIEIMPVANATVFFSEVGEALLVRYPLIGCAAYYWDRSDGKRQWGLRSRPDFDCSVIAKAFGGGGHKQASGFVEDGK